jgi:hypothetical protein
MAVNTSGCRRVSLETFGIGANLTLVSEPDPALELSAFRPAHFNCEGRASRIAG